MDSTVIDIHMALICSPAMVPEVFLDFSPHERAVVFLSRRFAALSCGEKSRKTSGTRVMQPSRVGQTTENSRRLLAGATD